jgi:hypothetical protein
LGEFSQTNDQLIVDKPLLIHHQPRSSEEFSDGPDFFGETPVSNFQRADPVLLFDNSSGTFVDFGKGKDLRVGWTR